MGTFHRSRTHVERRKNNFGPSKIFKHDHCSGHVDYGVDSPDLVKMDMVSRLPVHLTLRFRQKGECHNGHLFDFI